jgi:hypothetical protein
MIKKIPNIGACPLAVYGMIALFLFICSCSQRTNKNSQQEEKGTGVKPLTIKKPVSSFNDTIIIDSKSAVFYSPDSLQMEHIKAVNEKSIFAMIAHDCFYQMQNARMVLKKYWPGIQVIETSKARYLLFEKADRTKICIDLNNKNDICGIFLFERKKLPVPVDMPNIDTALSFYFKDTNSEASKKDMSLKYVALCEIFHHLK